MFHRSDLSLKGETGSVKGETISVNFGKGKCKFSATMVTSLPSHYFRLTTSVSLSLSLSHRLYLTHNIGSASALPIIREKNRIRKGEKKRNCGKATSQLQHGESPSYASVNMVTRGDA